MRIFTLWTGPVPGRARAGKGRSSPEDAFESSISDFEIRLMNEMLRAADSKSHSDALQSCLAS